MACKCFDPQWILDSSISRGLTKKTLLATTNMCGELVPSTFLLAASLAGKDIIEVEGGRLFGKMNCIEK
jgi:hypothetical protein